jgi:glycosyltransferase involved in cell wall biosynthesis
VYVSNGVPVETLAGGRGSSGRDGTFRMGYFGGHAISNDLSTLIEAARLLADQPVEFHLTGSGPLKGELARQASGLQKVHFHDEVPPAEARRQMRGMNALCIVGVSTALYAYGISPNRVFDYMAAGRPVIQAIDAPSSPVELAGCGVLCEPGSAPALAQILNDLMSRPANELDDLGRAGRAYVIRDATYPDSPKFADALQGVEKRGRNR